MKLKLFPTRAGMFTLLLCLALPACENDDFWVYTEQVHSHSDYKVIVMSTWFFSNLSGFELGKILLIRIWPLRARFISIV